MNKKKIIPELALIRSAAALAVVAIHVSATVRELPTTEVWGGAWYVSVLSEGITRFAVPVFIMLTGLLLLNPCKEESMFVFYRKRLSRLIIPFAFWIVFYLWFENFLQASEANAPDIVLNPTLRHFAGLFISGNVFYHLWYLFVLPPLYIFTPFLRIFVKNAGIKERYLLILLIFLFAYTNKAVIEIFPDFTFGNETFLTMFLPYLGYYLLGSEFSRGDMTSKFKYAGYASILMIIILDGAIILAARFLGVGKMSIIWDPISFLVLPYSVIIYFFLFNLYNKGVFKNEKIRKFLNSTAKNGLGIYLLHPFYIELLKMTEWLEKINSSYFILVIPLLTVFIFILCHFTIKILACIPIVKRIAV